MLVSWYCARQRVASPRSFDKYKVGEYEKRGPRELSCSFDGDHADLVVPVCGFSLAGVSRSTVKGFVCFFLFSLKQISCCFGLFQQARSTSPGVSLLSSFTVFERNIRAAPPLYTAACRVQWLPRCVVGFFFRFARPRSLYSWPVALWWCVRTSSSLFSILCCRLF